MINICPYLHRITREQTGKRLSVTGNLQHRISTDKGYLQFHYWYDNLRVVVTTHFLSACALKQNKPQQTGKLRFYYCVMLTQHGTIRCQVVDIVLRPTATVDSTSEILWAPLTLPVNGEKRTRPQISGLSRSGGRNLTSRLKASYGTALCQHVAALDARIILSLIHI